MNNQADFRSPSIVIAQCISNNRNDWQVLIDDSLRSWLRDPSKLEDCDVEAPSDSIIRLAIRVALVFRDQVGLPPCNIVPDASGGIVFEWRSSTNSESLHIWDDGSIEFFRFRDSRLIERRAFASQPYPMTTAPEPVSSLSSVGMRYFKMGNLSSAAAIGVGVASAVASPIF